jgi:hypothetical protein
MVCVLFFSVTERRIHFGLRIPSKITRLNEPVTAYFLPLAKILFTAAVILDRITNNKGEHYENKH